MTVLITVLGAFAVPPVSAWAWWRILPRWLTATTILPGWACAAAYGIGLGVVSPWWSWAAGSGASLAVCFAVWWWRRSKRRRAAAWLGAKSKALIAALVARVRQSGQPRRVLRPVPGGAS